MAKKKRRGTNKQVLNKQMSTTDKLAAIGNTTAARVTVLIFMVLVALIVVLSIFGNKGEENSPVQAADPAVQDKFAQAVQLSHILLPDGKTARIGDSLKSLKVTEWEGAEVIEPFTYDAVLITAPYGEVALGVMNEHDHAHDVEGLPSFAYQVTLDIDLGLTDEFVVWDHDGNKVSLNTTINDVREVMKNILDVEEVDDGVFALNDDEGTPLWMMSVLTIEDKVVGVDIVGNASMLADRIAGFSLE